MTPTEFLATLPAPLVLRGEGRTEYVTSTALAKRIRTELGLAVKAGALPRGTKLSVRVRPGGYHRSLTVEITGWEGAVFSDEFTACLLAGDESNWDPGYRSGRRHRDARLAPALCDALEMIEAIADRHNFDESQIEVDYFHVGYYLTVCASSVESVAKHGIELERSPEFAELVAKATAAAELLGPDRVRKECGRSGLQGAGRWSLERLIKLAARAA